MLILRKISDILMRKRLCSGPHLVLSSPDLSRSGVDYGLRKFLSTPILQKESGSTTTTTVGPSLFLHDFLSPNGPGWLITKM